MFEAFIPDAKGISGHYINIVVINVRCQHNVCRLSATVRVRGRGLTGASRRKCQN